MGSMEDALRKAGVKSEPPEPPAEKACARCGKTFRPARLQHKLCAECIAAVRTERTAEAATKAGEVAEKPSSTRPVGEKPAETAAAGPETVERRAEPARARAPRRDRPPGTRGRDRGPGRGIAPVMVHGLPADYLEGGYFTPAGSLRSELITHWAEQIAQGVAWPPTDSTAHQLRVFHNHVKRAVASCRFGGQPIRAGVERNSKVEAVRR